MGVLAKSCASCVLISWTSADVETLIASQMPQLAADRRSQASQRGFSTEETSMDEGEFSTDESPQLEDEESFGSREALPIFDRQDYLPKSPDLEVFSQLENLFRNEPVPHRREVSSHPSEDTTFFVFPTARFDREPSIVQKSTLRSPNSLTTSSFTSTHFQSEYPNNAFDENNDHFHFPTPFRNDVQFPGNVTPLVDQQSNLPTETIKTPTTMQENSRLPHSVNIAPSVLATPFPQAFQERESNVDSEGSALKLSKSRPKSPSDIDLGTITLTNLEVKQPTITSDINVGTFSRIDEVQLSSPGKRRYGVSYFQDNCVEHDGDSVT